MKLRQIREAQKRKNKNNISQMRERLCRLTYLYADGPKPDRTKSDAPDEANDRYPHGQIGAAPGGHETKERAGQGASKTIPYVAHPNFANVGRGLSAPTPLALPRGYFREDEWAGR